MASKQIKKDTTLTSTPIDTTQGSSITYANEVVAIIAGMLIALPGIIKENRKK